MDLIYLLQFFSLWGQGQPDNWQDAIGSQEDCVEILQTQGGAWNDLPCSLRRHYICERDVNLGITKLFYELNF